MTKVKILPLPTKDGDISYHALAGDKQSIGKTAGEALDSLTSHLASEEKGTMIIVQNHQPDQFFGKEQYQRLSELMTEWRNARDQGEEFPPDKYSELKRLVEAELVAAGDRASALFEDKA